MRPPAWSSIARERLTNGRHVMLRRYTLNPTLADEFVAEVFPKVREARQALGFRVEGAWLNDDKSELTWLLSREGTAQEFADADERWVISDVRAEIFLGRPRFVLDANIAMVTEVG